MEAKNIDIVLLAAGKSERLGKPKQLLSFDGQSLLQHAIQEASHSDAGQIIVVLGANADILRPGIDPTTAHVVVNAEWEEGMASSIRRGINALNQIVPSSEGVILMVCDQPYVTSSLLNDLIETYQKTGNHIVTCSYENTFGPPTLFHKSHFPELIQLKGDTGARKVVERHPGDVEVVLFPEGKIDIDTKADYEKHTKSNRD